MPNDHPYRKNPGKKATRPDLSVNLGHLRLKNPVLAASGTFGYGLELAAFCPPQKLGAVITKGLSLEPWPGNPNPRIIEAGFGLINAIGLENVGVQVFLEKYLEPLKNTGAVVGANVLGKSANDYVALTQILAQSQVDFIELNVSCPNLKHPGGLSFGSDPVTLAQITQKSVEIANGKPIVVKLPPLVTDIVSLALIAQENGASAVSLINSLPALSINLEKRQANLANGPGGLSGPPIKPLALRQVALCAKSLSIPIIGLGGIMDYQDALEFIVAGATAVQIGTGILVDPTLPTQIVNGIAAYLESNDIHTLGEIRDTLRW
ncbi:MAG: dihydroorotate dehydrogenase [Deltaproteobacteria bacterium]|nr:dihydroorotate dehydrogenase [Deltaproteobacteria bacterium]